MPTEHFHTAPLFLAAAPDLPTKRLGANGCPTPDTVWHRWHYADMRDLAPDVNDSERGAWDRYVWKAERSWSGVDSVPEAKQLARDGWKEGAIKAKAVWDGLVAEMPKTRRQLEYGYVGHSVSVARMLSGHPKHMRRRALTETPAARPIVTLIASLGANWAISAQSILDTAIAQAAIVDMLQMRGYRCNVLAVKRSTQTSKGAFGSEIIVQAKQAGQPLNLSVLTYVLGHPGMIRALCLGHSASHDICKPLDSNLGYPTNPVQSLAKPGTYVMLGTEELDKERGAKAKFHAILAELRKAGCPGIPAA